MSDQLLERVLLIFDLDAEDRGRLLEKAGPAGSRRAGAVAAGFAENIRGLPMADEAKVATAALTAVGLIDQLRDLEEDVG